MLIRRNGDTPRIHPTAHVAPSAQIIGNVTVGAQCFVDYNVVIESSGAPIVLDDNVIVLANTVIRSVGGEHRPPFPVHIGAQSLISPLCALAGCRIGRRCYIATGAMIFQGADVGDTSRIAAGAIVHLRTMLPPGTHIGLRHLAAPAEDGFIVTPDPEAARGHVAAADFFHTVFGEKEADQETLHHHVMSTLTQEVFGWIDEPIS